MPSDAQLFINELIQEGAFFQFATDEEGRLGSIFWATKEQVDMARRYSSVVIQDNTFSTNA